MTERERQRSSRCGQHMDHPGFTIFSFPARLHEMKHFKDDPIEEEYGGRSGEHRYEVDFGSDTEGSRHQGEEPPQQYECRSSGRMRDPEVERSGNET